MSASNKTFKLKRALTAFRLSVANVIIGNGPHIQRHTRDISDISHIAELCDQYALMILLNWLGTKCGFPIYKQAIESEAAAAVNSALPLLSWASLADRYPFHLYEKCILSEQSIRQMFSLLDETIPSNLELAGDLYQQIISTSLAISEGKMLGLSKEAQLRAGGEFYTPRWVTDLAFNYWQDSLDIDRIDLSIYDPSCGCGNFLLAAVRNASKRATLKNELISFVSDCLYGTDLDGRAIDIARVLVLIATWIAIKESEATCKGPHAFNADEVYMAICKNITVNDSLLSAIAKVDLQKKYDLVITNPPYISFGSRDQQALGAGWQRFLKQRFQASSEYKIRYSSIFQEIGLANAKENGQAIFFVPDAFLTGGYYQKLRSHILQNTKIISLSELPEKTMDGVTVGRWCLAQYQISNPMKAEKKAQGEHIKLRSFCSSDTDKASKEFSLPLATLVSNDKSRFQLIFSKYDQEILESCRNLASLNSILQGRTGIRARAGQNSVIAETPKSPLHRPGIISGSELKPYAVDWSGHFIEINSSKLFAGGFDEQVISNPKILLRQTGDSLIAAIDCTGLYHLNNVHSFSTIKKSVSSTRNSSTQKNEATQISLLNDGSLTKMLCLMNSSFYKYFYGLKTREQKMALAQIDIETVEHMPLPNGLLEDTNDLETLAAEIKELVDEERAKDPRKEAKQAYKTAISQKQSKVDKIIFELFAISNAQRAHIEDTLGTTHLSV